MDTKMLEILERIENKFDAGLNRLENKFNNLENKFDNLENKVNIIETKLDEHTLILRALEHSAEINKAEHDKMSNDIAKIQGDIVGIKKDLSQVEMVTANNWADIAKLKAVK